MGIFNGTDLVDMAVELLRIQQDFCYHLNNGQKYRPEHFDLYTHVQMWGNTSGGFCGMGGCAMTAQRVYVFVPTMDDEDCQVYFGGAFGYKVPYSEVFMADLREHNIAGKPYRGKYVQAATEEVTNHENSNSRLSAE